MTVFSFYFYKVSINFLPFIHILVTWVAFFLVRLAKGLSILLFSMKFWFCWFCLFFSKLLLLFYKNVIEKEEFGLKEQ